MQQTPTQLGSRQAELLVKDMVAKKDCKKE